MRFNQTTLLNIALIVIFGLALTQAEAYMGDYQIYILKLIFINAILALSEEDVLQTEASPCIRCGRCVDACPMHLVPPSIAAAYKNGDPAAMEKLDVGSCMECGCCSFACPAHRHIVQTMRMAKDAVRRAHMADRA